MGEEEKGVGIGVGVGKAIGEDDRLGNKKVTGLGFG
jgi:hypothetical protein